MSFVDIEEEEYNAWDREYQEASTEQDPKEHDKKYVSQHTTPLAPLR